MPVDVIPISMENALTSEEELSVASKTQSTAEVIGDSNEVHFSSLQAQVEDDIHRFGDQVEEMSFTPVEKLETSQ